MLETFCASVNFKSLLLQHHDMAVVEKFMVIVEKATQDRSHDPLAGIILDADAAPLSTIPKQPKQSIHLSQRALMALKTMYQQLFDKPMPHQPPASQTHHWQSSFTTQAESVCNCNIFFRSTIGAIAPRYSSVYRFYSVGSNEIQDGYLLCRECYAQVMADGDSSPFSFMQTLELACGQRRCQRFWRQFRWIMLFAMPSHGRG